jgi:indolepyruvate ferredoxin oxidoreductase beta subunit
MKYDVVLCGLGGQGIIFTGKLLSSMAMGRSWPVIGAETHGMAQRGGSVVAHLRFGDVVGSLVPEASADTLISLSEAEAYRNMNLVKPEGCVFLNGQSFPWNQITDYVNTNNIQGRAIDADTLAVENNLPKAVNLIVLGFACASGLLPFDVDELKSAVKTVAKEAFWDDNFKAIDLGVGQSQNN